MCSFQLWNEPSEFQQAAIKAMEQNYGRSVRAFRPMLSKGCVYRTDGRHMNPTSSHGRSQSKRLFIPYLIDLLGDKGWQ